MLSRTHDFLPSEISSDCAPSSKIKAILDFVRVSLVTDPKAQFSICGQSNQGTCSSETPIQWHRARDSPDGFLGARGFAVPLLTTLTHWYKGSDQLREFSSDFSCCYWRRVSWSKSASPITLCATNCNSGIIGQTKKSKIFLQSLPQSCPKGRLQQIRNAGIWRVVSGPFKR